MVGDINKKFIIFALIYLTLSINFVSASFTIGNPSSSIPASYEPGEALSGWINISLNNEPTNSFIESSLGGGISLIDLLKANYNVGFVYTCNPSSCNSNYIASGEAPSKSLNLNENDSFFVGLDIFGNYVTSISDFSMKISSNSPETQKVPLMIDILNDGQTEWQTYTSSGNFVPSSENFGCFGAATGSANIVYGYQNQYCEKISLTRAPEVEIGAYVKGNVGVASNFVMKIINSENGEYSSCTASAAGTGVGERIACIPASFPIEKEGDYFVCISASSNPSNPSDYYKINYEQTAPVCGFTGSSYQNSYTYDFEIFARQEEYAAGANFTLNNEELAAASSPVTNIEQYLKNYISNIYHNNCSSGCVIPIKISSGVGQQVDITDVSITYSAGISTTVNSIFDVHETPAQITSGFQKLYLDDAGFNVPTNYGNHSVSITLNGNALISKSISVGETPGIKSLIPTKTAVKYPTKFTVLLNSSENVTEYEWDFGNGDKQITAINSVTYTYNTVGTYNLNVKIVDTMNSSKSFNITIGPASEIVPLLMAEEQSNIESIKTQYENFSQFEKNSINKALNIDNLQKNLTQLKNSLSNSSSESAFEAALGNLLSIKLPLTVAKTAYSNGLTFYPESSNINLDVLSKITDSTYDSGKESAYKQAILAWNEEYASNSLTYNEISAIYPDYQEPLLKTFDISITKSSSDNAYLIIKDMDNIMFQQDYSQKKTNGYYYISLDSGFNEVVFSTTEDVNFVDVPMFSSPAISSLVLSEGGITQFLDTSSKKWINFAIIIGIIILIVAVVWILLGIWYKRKYEDHLFKNKNNLYNLINYIRSSKEKGMKEGEIADKLKKAGWNSEQATYALKKYSGKRTGMPGIPEKSILKKNKKTR